VEKAHAERSRGQSQVQTFSGVNASELQDSLPKPLQKETLNGRLNIDGGVDMSSDSNVTHKRYMQNGDAIRPQ
jgi:hypothetical protein